MDTKKIKEIALKGHQENISDVALMKLAEAYAKTQGKPGGKKYNQAINYFYEEVALRGLVAYSHTEPLSIWG